MKTAPSAYINVGACRPCFFVRLRIEVRPAVGIRFATRFKDRLIELGMGFCIDCMSYVGAYMPARRGEYWKQLSELYKHQLHAHLTGAGASILPWTHYASPPSLPTLSSPMFNPAPGSPFNVESNPSHVKLCQVLCCIAPNDK